MPDPEEIVESFPAYLPVLVTLGVVVAILLAARWWFGRRAAQVGHTSSFTRPIAMLALTAVGLIAIIVALPLNDGVKNQLMGLFGLVLTGMIALSSTTFVANAMSGFMIRAIRSFRSGDFVRVGSHFGRVSERGLFHTELQTEDRDLTTLPNLFLVTNPVTVVRSSGTMIKVEISLGYDVHHSEVEQVLKEAAMKVGLEEPFVRVLALGDFSVSYRVAGLLRDVKHLLSKRSELHAAVLDAVHGADIEILSPNAMMQRPLKDGQRIMPPCDTEPFASATGAVDVATPEAVLFDKAEEAEQQEMIGFEMERLLEEKKELEERLPGAEGELLIALQKRIQELDSQIELAKRNIEADAAED